MIIRRDAGNATLEAILLTPVLLGLVALAVAAGRIQLARAAIEAAASDAARQASIARTATAAHQAAHTSATATLSREGLACTPHVTVDTAGFSAPPGQAANVRARITCAVDLSDLVAVPGLPGSMDLSARADSPLDPYRAKDPGSAPYRTSSTP